MTRSLLRIVALFLPCLIVSCGGGGGGSSAPIPVATATATATPTLTPAPTPTPAPASATQVLSAGASAVGATFGTIAAGISGTTTLPAATSGFSSVTVTFGSSLPGGLPAVSSAARMPRAIGVSLTPIAFFSFSASNTVSFAVTPTFSLAGALSASGTYYVGIYDATSGWTLISGPAAASGGLSIPGALRATTFAAGTSTSFVIFSTVAPIPTPTPVPTPSPTPSPTPTTSPSAPATITPAPTATVGPSFAYMAQQNGSFVSAIGPTSRVGFVINVSTIPETSTSGTSPGLPTDALAIKVGSSATTFSTMRAPQSYLQKPVAVGISGRPAPVYIPSPKTFRPDFDPTENFLREAISRVRVATHTRRATNVSRRAQSLGTTIGSTANLWTSTAAIGQSSGGQIQIPATLLAVSQHAYIWVDNTLSLSTSSLNAIGSDFENAYASDVAHFGTPEFTVTSPTATRTVQPCDSAGNPLPNATPVGIVIPPPNGMHVVFIVNQSSLGSGLGGYFANINHFTQGFANCQSGQPKSNEASMIYLGFDPAAPLSYTLSEDLVRGTSHEFQHLINFVNKVVLAQRPVSEDRWINEGLSMLSQDYAVNRMFPSVLLDVDDALASATQFMQNPQRYSLTGFTGADSTGSFTYNCPGCYGLSYLYQRYLADRFGGDSYLRAIEASTTTSLAGIQMVTGVAPSQSIADFAVAVLQSGSGVTSDPRFNFTAFSPYGTYTDQFGQKMTLQGPGVLTASPSSTTTLTSYVGTFNYVQIQPLVGQGAGVTVNDQSGVFGLQAGLLQL